MIEYKGGTAADYTTENLMVAKLSADSKSEVKDDLAQMTIVGWPTGFGLAKDSTVITAGWEIARYDSTGHWHWA